LLINLLIRNSQAFLHASGQQIVNSTGTAVFLRGYGLGGWLVPEGYMLHTPGYGSPTHIDSLVRDLIGNQNTETFWELYRTNYVNRLDIQQMAEWGFNSIRLPFHYKTFYDPLNRIFRPEGFALLDSLLDWCEESNLYLILDMHCAPGGQNNGNISDSDGIEARLWTEPSIYQPLTIRIWQEIASRYVNDPRIGGYDLLNEPVLPDGYSNQVLRDFYIELTDSIRQLDSNHILFIEGNWYATDFSLLTPPWDSNMAYSFHKYWNETTLNSIQSYINMRGQHNVPLWLGETGENSNHWYYSVVRLMEQNNIGWCWWAHKKFDTITSPLSAHINPGYQVILNYWNGQAARPTAGYAFSAFLQMTEDLLLENCDYRPDVIKSLLDPDFGNISKPFVPLTIPGIINAVHYDFGTNAVSYIDQDYQNINGLGGSVYNQGYQYRNDGVDIEKSTDPLGFGYNVGWIETGERLIYTVEALHSGTYQAQLRVSSAQGGGQMVLFLDNQPLGSMLSIPNTGGWQNWIPINLLNLNISSGVHKLMIIFIQGDFNLNRMEFILTSSLDDGNDPLPQGYRLEQNYPNPYNSMTTISYYLPISDSVIIEIFDLAGERVSVLVDEEKTAGLHSVKFAKSDLSSGLYVYQMKSGSFQQHKKMLLVK
jgi:endoglucanase